MSRISPVTETVLRLLQASSCFRGEVCASLPCACAETLAALSAGHAQTPGLAWVKDMLDLYFAPWGAAKAARFEAMTGDKPFDPEVVLKLIHEKLKSPDTSTDREGK